MRPTKQLYSLAFTFTAMSLVYMCIAMTGCDSSSDPTTDPSGEDEFVEQLNGNWTLQAGTVTVDGVDVTNAFANMSITFNTNMTYTTTHGVAPIWPANGSFTVRRNSGGIYALVRNDGKELTVTSIDTTTLVFTMQYTADGARTSSVSGEYEFMMKR